MSLSLMRVTEITFPPYPLPRFAGLYEGLRGRISNDQQPIAWIRMMQGQAGGTLIHYKEWVGAGLMGQELATQPRSSLVDTITDAIDWIPGQTALGLKGSNKEGGDWSSSPYRLWLMHARHVESRDWDFPHATLRLLLDGEEVAKAIYDHNCMQPQEKFYIDSTEVNVASTAAVRHYLSLAWQRGRVSERLPDRLGPLLDKIEALTDS